MKEDAGIDSVASAAASAAGYDYQISQGLLALLKAGPEAALRLEALDDIALLLPTGVELSQVKLQLTPRPSALADLSEGLWNTIGNWARLIREAKVDPEHTMFYLLATAPASPDSLSAALALSKRDNDVLWNDLQSKGQSSKNEIVRIALKELQSMSLQNRSRLLANILLLPGQPGPENLDAATIKILRTWSTAYPIKLHERITGWWQKRVRTQLILHANGQPDSIEANELLDAIQEFADELRPDNLPADLEHLQAPPTDVSDDPRLFMRQLRLLDHSPRKLTLCLRDYYRASEQCIKWVKDGLARPDEISVFKSRLLDRWEAKFSSTNAMHLQEAEKIQAGKDILDWAESNDDTSIRPKFRGHYVRRGTYHELADDPQLILGWHPDYKEKLK